MTYMGESYVALWCSRLHATHLIFSGYIESCRSIVGTRQSIQSAIASNAFPELRVLGSPPGPVVAFTTMHPDRLSILAIGDAMSRKGWHLNALQNPAALHIACTVRRVTLRHVL